MQKGNIGVTTENIFKYEFSYKIVNNQKVIDHIEITGMLKAISDIEIPAEIEGYPVTVIRNYAFEECYNTSECYIYRGLCIQRL